MSCNAGCCNNLKILTVYHSKGLCLALVTSQGGQWMLGNWMLSSKQWFRSWSSSYLGLCWFLDFGVLLWCLCIQPLASLHLAVCGRRKVDGYAGRLRARPVGSLFFFFFFNFPLLFHWSAFSYIAVSPTVRLGYVVFVPRKKKEWAWQTWDTALATPEH